MRYLMFSLIFTISACNNSTHEEKKEQWKTNDYINQTQILLTNEYKIGESSGYGASAFLIESVNNGELVCSAKHLLGEAMGISPEIRSDDFNKKLDYWLVYPRNFQVSSDTLAITKLVNEDINNTDIILMEYDQADSINLQVLKPRLSDVKKGEKLEIIGCEYVDYPCHQKIYDAVMDEYDNDGMLIIKSSEIFDASGFSGAPVIDKNGLAVGVLSGAAEFGDEYFLWIEPLTKVKSYLE